MLREGQAALAKKAQRTENRYKIIKNDAYLALKRRTRSGGPVER